MVPPTWALIRAWTSFLRLRRALQREREHQAEQGERLDHREAEDQPGAVEAGRLGLAGAGLDVGGEDDTDADAGADGGKTVADGAELAADVDGGEKVGHRN